MIFTEFRARRSILLNAPLLLILISLLVPGPTLAHWSDDPGNDPGDTNDTIDRINTELGTIITAPDGTQYSSEASGSDGTSGSQFIQPGSRAYQLALERGLVVENSYNNDGGWVVTDPTAGSGREMVFRYETDSSSSTTVGSTVWDLTGTTVLRSWADTTPVYTEESTGKEVVASQVAYTRTQKITEETLGWETTITEGERVKEYELREYRWVGRTPQVTYTSNYQLKYADIYELGDEEYVDYYETVQKRRVRGYDMVTHQRLLGYDEVWKEVITGYNTYQERYVARYDLVAQYDTYQERYLKDYRLVEKHVFSHYDKEPMYDWRQESYVNYYKLVTTSERYVKYYRDVYETNYYYEYEHDPDLGFIRVRKSRQVYAGREPVYGYQTVTSMEPVYGYRWEKYISGYSTVAVYETVRELEPVYGYRWVKEFAGYKREPIYAYRTVSEPIYQRQLVQEPIYETYTVQEPIYEYYTEQEPVYATRETRRLINSYLVSREFTGGSTNTSYSTASNVTQESVLVAEYDDVTTWTQQHEEILVSAVYVPPKHSLTEETAYIEGDVQSSILSKHTEEERRNVTASTKTVRYADAESVAEWVEDWHRYTETTVSWKTKEVTTETFDLYETTITTYQYQQPVHQQITRYRVTTYANGEQEKEQLSQVTMDRPQHWNRWTETDRSTAYLGQRTDTFDGPPREHNNRNLASEEFIEVTGVLPPNARRGDEITLAAATSPNTETVQAFLPNGDCVRLARTAPGQFEAPYTVASDLTDGLQQVTFWGYKGSITDQDQQNLLVDGSAQIHYLMVNLIN